jgi:hypothetical protein
MNKETEAVIFSCKLLINWRYDQLMKIEKDPWMKGLYHFYLGEWDEFFKPMQDRKKFGFSDPEKILPMLFTVLYACGFIGAIAIAIF